MGNPKIELSRGLHIWSCLETAMSGTNPYGGNIAEIYVEHLIPKNAEITKNTWREAGETLHPIIQQFCQVHNCRAFINGRVFGNWLRTFEIRHKCDVRIAVRKANNGKQNAKTT